MRAQRFLSRKITFVLAILMITSGLQILVTTPASATNPVGSIQFANNGSLKYSAGAPGSQNTTIEFWMKQTSTGGIQRIFTTSWSFGPSNVTIRTQGNTCLVVAVANVELSLTAGTNYSCPTLNAWHHIALVGLGTTWKLYVDGTLARTSSWSEANKPNITDGDAWIGGWGSLERFNGYVSNFRYVIGTAVYTSNFTPPSPPLAATQSAGGPGVGAISSGTTLLLNTRYNNTLATAQVDTSGNGRTPTLYGTPVASSDSPPISVACSAGGSFTTSKLPDGQAMLESANSMLSAVNGGANFILHSAGFLDGLLSMSYEKFMLDADYCGALHSYLAGVTVDDNSLAISAFEEVGPGNHFLGCAHTMANYTTAFFDSKISDNDPFETWQDNGSLDSAVRANKRWKKALAEYQAPALDESIDEALKDFINRKKASMPDQWY